MFDFDEYCKIAMACVVFEENSEFLFVLHCKPCKEQLLLIDEVTK